MKGTKKQVEWAIKLKAELLRGIVLFAKHYDDLMSKEDEEKVTRIINRCKSAKWFIDNMRNKRTKLTQFEIICRLLEKIKQRRV